MAEVKIEFLGEGVDEAVFLRWLKKEKDVVEKGEFICEVETYKAVIQIESNEKGVLKSLKCRAGDVIKIPVVVGEII